VGKPIVAETEYRAGLAIKKKLVADFPSVPDYRYRLAIGHRNLARLLRKLNRMDLAEVEDRAAIDVGEKLVAEFPDDPNYRSELARSHGDLGIVLATLGKRDHAETEHRIAIDMQKKLMADFPAIPANRVSRAVGHLLLGDVLDDSGRLDQAQTEYRAAIEIEKKLMAEFPELPKYRWDLAKSHYDLGNRLAKWGKPDEAQAEYRAAIDTEKDLPAQFSYAPEYTLALAGAFCNLGNLLRDGGQPNDALERFDQAIARLSDLVQKEPGHLFARQFLSKSHWGRAQTLDRLKPDQAPMEYRVVLDIQKKLTAEFPEVLEYRRELASSHYDLAILLANGGKPDRAQAEYRAAIDIQKKLVAEFPWVREYRHALAQSHNNRGIVLADLGKRDQAEAEYRAAIDIKKKLTADFPDVPQYAITLAGTFCNLGHLLRDGGQPNDALEGFDQAIARLSVLVQKEPGHLLARQFLCNSHWGRARTLDQLKRPEEAVKDWASAMSLTPQKERMTFHHALMLSRIRAGQFELALKDADHLAKSAAKEGAYDCACVYALAHAKTKEDKHAARAVELLRQAFTKGFRDVAHLKKDADLDSLRARDDFQQLLEAAKRTHDLRQNLLTGQHARHRFIETKHEGALTAEKRKQAHPVEMKAGRTYVLDLESKAFDTLMILEDADGTLLAENDDISAANLNSRIIFTAQRTATYRVIATAFTLGSTGSYVVRIRELVREK